MTDYYRFEQSRVLNLISTTNSNIVYDKSEKIAVSSGLESILLWNTRTGALHQTWTDRDNKAEATYISRCPSDSNIFAVGYFDGSIRLWDQSTKESTVTFQGHKSAVICLAWDHTGSKLASGSRDCDIIVWDILSESGLYRLRGHTNGVTDLVFVNESNTLISCSKDTFVKVWDLATQHCLETIVTHRAEITSLFFDMEESILMTFGADQHIRLFKAELENIGQILAAGAEHSENLKVFNELETIDRSSKDRVLSVGVKDEFVCVLSSDKSMEIFRMNYKGETKKAKSSKKMLSTAHHSRFSDKPLSFDISHTWSITKNNNIKLVLNFNNNSIQEWCVPLDRQSEKEKISGVEFVGHRNDVKALCISSDNSLLASVSSEAIKVWNLGSGACIRSFTFEDGTVSAFIPGDKNLLVASKTGLVNVFDLVSGNCTMSLEAHTGAVWSLQIAPDQKGFITGGSDKTVKFWEFKKDKSTGALSKIKHLKTLQLSDEVLAVKYSPDMRLLAVSLVDMTVKVFFEDSLKLALSLYGHKLPVTSMDISQDGSTIVTVSSDKNIKIWSLQFGDCRKSIFAHQEPITFVSFLGGSTEFITASKDKTIRYWDANKFVALQKITGHHSEIWATAVNRLGDTVVTASTDKSIRVWSRSDELLFPEEEEEKEMDETIDASILAENPHGSKDDGDSRMATKATVSAMKSGERIVEALEVANIETQKRADFALAKENGITLELQAPEPLLLAAGKDKTPAELVMWAVNQVPLAELEEALLTLPISLVPNLLSYVIEWFKNRLNLVLACRVLNLLLKVHYNQIIANGALRSKLETLRLIQSTQLKEFKDTVGYNIAAMKMLAN